MAGILANGGPIDGIGIQGSVNARLTPMERAGAIPDRFARFGRDLRITEFDIPDKSRNDGRKSAVNQRADAAGGPACEIVTASGATRGTTRGSS